MYFKILAGLPTKFAKVGTSFVTIAIAPITAPSPIVIPCNITALAPIPTTSEIQIYFEITSANLIFFAG
jgi:hypothetical protein